MKKMKGLFAALAIVFAGIGVYTTTFGAVVTQYWINNPSAGTVTNCDIQVTHACDPGFNTQCNLYVGGSAPVFKKDSAGTSCEVFQKR